jgi:virginiamycin B lyase
MRRFRAFALACGFALAGCGGGGGNSPVPGAPQGTSGAAFVVRVPARSSASAASAMSRPQYISPATQSVAISVSGESAAVVANLTPASPNCTPASGSTPLTCTVVVTAPVGTDTFTVAMYGRLNGGGPALSKGSVTADVVANQTTPVNVVTGGVVDSIALTLANPAPALGKAAKIALTVTAKDSAGCVIVGPGAYTTPIALSDTDAKYTSLSTTTVTSPGAPVTLNYNGGALVSATISASAAGVPPARIANATVTPQGFLSYPIPTANSNPIIIVSGPDGNLWFDERGGNKIGRVTTAGAITEFTVPTANSAIGGIGSGPDGNLWFTEQNSNKIGRITTAGAITEFNIPTAGSQPLYISGGPDGNVWFTEGNGNKIGRITPAGAIAEFPVPTAASQPQGIGTGPDGAVWFTESIGNKIGRITTAGLVTEYAVPTANSYPLQIVTGADGNLWFTEINANKVAKITPSGTITEFATPTANSAPALLTPGPGGDIWFAELSANNLASITPAGKITEIPVTTPNSGPGGIALGSDGYIWFLESTANNVAKYVP